MIDIERRNLAVIMEAGYIYVGMKRFKEARELFDGLSAIAPDSEIPFVAMGNVDFCEGKLTRAIKNYNVALKINPNSVFAKVYLGEALFFLGKKVESLKLLSEVAKKDRSGAGDFARALLDAVKAGFKPARKAG